MNTTSKYSLKPNYLRLLITVGILILTTGLLMLNRNQLIQSLSVLKTAAWAYVAAAVGLLLLSFLLAAAIYVRLSLKPIRYLPTVLIEVASSALNKLLPAGLAGLGLHGAYLYKQRHTTAEATAVVSTNNLIGILAHGLILILVIIINPTALHAAHLHIAVRTLIIFATVVTTLILIFSVVPMIRRRALKFLKNLAESLQIYRKHPTWLLVALLLAISLTSAYTAILYVAAQALHLHVSLQNSFIIFSIGMAVGTATPTPGGVIGAEAGLFTGFIAYGLSQPNALAIVILFRLITYWLPIIPGTIALVLARRLRLV